MIKQKEFLTVRRQREGRIKHHFLALKPASIVFIQVKRELATGKH